MHNPQPVTSRQLAGWSPLALCALLCSACTSFQAPPELHGYWASAGYGRILAVSGTKLEVYDRTATTCVAAKETAAELRAILSSSQLEFLPDASQVDLMLANEPFKRRYQRLDRLPEVCTTPTENTPVLNFEAFTNYFAEHYAFFDLFGVDWSERTSAARLKINNQSTDAELYAVFSDLLSPLQDAHINLFAQVAGDEVSYGPEQSPVSKALNAQAASQGVPVNQLQQQLLKSLWEDNIEASILQGQGQTAANGFIQHGLINKTNGDRLGYIAVQREGGYGDPGQSLAVLNQVLDTAINQWNQAKVAGVIIDIAVNFGGSDYLGRAIARRFTNQRTMAYSKRAADRADAQDFPLYLEPYPGPRFTGPVTLVTSTSTVSAGEILAMSLRSLPTVTHIGEPTRGSLSDILDKTLPNGWVVTLSNEVYLDHQGKLWEGPGIRPHQPMVVLDPADPVASHLQAIQGAIALTPLR